MRSPSDVLLRNWPLKLAALALATILWVVLAAEEPTSALVDVRLEVDVPASLALAGPPPSVRALVTGPARELIKLYTTPPVVRVAVPATAQPPRYRLALSPSDVTVPRRAKATIQDVEPRELEVEVDRFAQRDVPVALRAVVEAESGFAVAGRLVVTPPAVEVSGARARVFGLDSVFTEPIEVRGLTRAFERTVPLDTTTERLVRIFPREVTVTGRVRPL